MVPFCAGVDGQNWSLMTVNILVEIIRIVVVKVETLRGIALRFFGDANHEDFTAENLNFLVLFARGRV